jgi:hypothetical protein
MKRWATVSVLCYVMCNLERKNIGRGLFKTLSLHLYGMNEEKMDNCQRFVLCDV